MLDLADRRAIVSINQDLFTWLKVLRAGPVEVGANLGGKVMRLERMGLIELRPDGRRRLAALTAKGEAALTWRRAVAKASGWKTRNWFRVLQEIAG